MNETIRTPESPDMINLITPQQFDSLPNGTVLRNIFGERKIKGSDYIENETRAGFLSVGFTAGDLLPANLQLDTEGHSQLLRRAA